MGAGTVCDTVDSDSTGIVVAGYGTSGQAGPCITRWDVDLNKDTTFFVPDAGWRVSENVVTLRFTDDDNYLYAMADAAIGFDYLYKFDCSDGSEVWKIHPTSMNQFGMYVDSSDGVWFIKFGALGSYLQHYNSSGVYVEQVFTYHFIRDVEVDETNSRVYVCGKTNQIGSLLLGDPAKYHSISARDIDGGNFNYVTHDITGTNATVWNILLHSNGYLYAAGDRAQAGVGGAWASVWKYDSSLTLQASYDTGLTSYEVWINHDGNISVASGFYPGGGGGTNAGVWVLDTDLNYVSDSRVQLDNIYGNEAANIPYVSTSTPGYWTIYDENGDALDFSHLIGETVCILADGVVYPSQVVDDNGRIDPTEFSTATKLHIGLNYCSILKPMKPMSQAAMMTKNATCKEMGLSFHNTDDSDGRSEAIANSGVRYGVRETDLKEIDFTDPQWKNKCDKDGLFTGSVAVAVPEGFDKDMPLMIKTCDPLPCVVRAMIPKVDVTGR